MADKADTRPITAAVQAYANGDLTRDELIARLKELDPAEARPMTSVGDDHYEVNGTWREVDFAWSELGLPYDDFVYVFQKAG